MANADESKLDYPLGDTLPAPGRSIEVAPGVRWLRMALPFALDHINLWLLRDVQDGPNGPVQGWTIVDCGIANDETKALWEQVSNTNWAACRCCASWSRTCTRTTSAWRTG